jgi:hypothetical protein
MLVFQFDASYKSIIEMYIRLLIAVKVMTNSNRSTYVCFSNEEIHILQEFAKRKGALNVSQALESLVKDRNN